MQAVVYSFSRRGAELSKKVCACLTAAGYNAAAQTLPKYAADAGIGVMLPDYKTACAEAFDKCGVIIFVGAAGIAVRTIAPYIKSKLTDPAVISVDEKGNFVIPLLAGHIGGANEIARYMAKFLGGIACVTTATDVNGLFAVDEWAARNRMTIDSMHAAKEFAAALVAEETVGLTSEFPVVSALPKGMKLYGEGNIPAVGLNIALNTSNTKFATTLHVLPRIVHLGIGCRRGTECANIAALVLPELERLHIDKRSVCSIASVDLKKDEKGLLEFAALNGWQANFYTADELNAVAGEFTPSNFVRGIVGVDNVCERSAVKDSNGGNLLLHKTSKNGVTLAVAVEDIVIDFFKTGLKTE